VARTGLKVLILFEGRGSAGKGGVIKRITERTSPRIVRVVALPKPTEREQSQWYFQRYVEHLPAAGEIVLFDRSWYNRSNVEWVMGFCTEDQHQEFLRSCPEFERMLVRSGITVLKYWFSVSYQEQKQRFESRNAEPLKRWKLSDMDLEEHRQYVRYSMAKDTTFQFTDIKQAPWFVVPSDDKRAARLNCMTHILDQFEYQDVLPDPVVLPEREELPYVRPPMSDQTFVPQIW
jgi:polyphosphate kinase 2